MPANPAVPIPPGRDIPVVEVDASDNVIGVVQRHDLFARHVNFRVVHIFVFNDSGHLLLQRLAHGHRHPGLLGSSVASYVEPPGDYRRTARTRLRQELGIAAPIRLFGKTALEDLGSEKFITLFLAAHNGPFRPDPTQVTTVRFWSTRRLDRAVRLHPDRFTPTFRHVYAFYSRGRGGAGRVIRRPSSSSGSAGAVGGALAR